MRLPQTSDSLASGRKRRRSQPRACGCEWDCDRATACKKHKKVEDKGLANRSREEHSSEKGKDDSSRTSPGPVQRRSLRIQEILQHHEHLEDKKDCLSQPEKKNGEGSKPLREGAKLEKKERSRDDKPESNTMYCSDRPSCNGVYTKHGESWDTRLRYRLRNSKHDYTKLQRQEVKDNEEQEEKAEHPEQNRGVTTRGKRQREQELDGCNDLILPKEEDDPETEIFKLMPWARKSRRKPRARKIFKAETDNGGAIVATSIPDLNLSQPDMACKDSEMFQLDLVFKDSDSLRPSLVSKNLHRHKKRGASPMYPEMAEKSCDEGNRTPWSQKKTDRIDVYKSVSLSSIYASDLKDGENPARKAASDILLMKNSLVPDVLQIRNEIPAAQDPNDQLEVMLCENTNRKFQGKNHSLGKDLKDPITQCTGTVISRNCITDGKGIHGRDVGYSNEISPSEACIKGQGCQGNPPESGEYSRDLGGQKPRGSKDSSSDMINQAKLLDFEDSNTPTKSQNLNGSSKPVLASTIVAANETGSKEGIAHACDINSRERILDDHVEDMNIDATLLEPSEMDASVRQHGISLSEATKDITETGARHFEDATVEVANDMTELNSKRCKLAQLETAQATEKTGRLDSRESVKPNSNVSAQKANDTVSFKFEKSAIIEGRKCSLCGVGNDGKPPKKLSQDGTDSENEMSANLQAATEEPMYRESDGFGHDTGWLGRLLGPLSDRFGIAGVWVHRQCAVWSPEVYFSGVGCLKNVRAALARGRTLKCSRCGRPGATIGCRVDRCPRTYHLACGRTEGCVFDHRKFLMACTDHYHVFRPRGRRYRQEMRKMRFRRLVIERRKASAAALRKDLEAEEKWLENCGEDEEFLRRERKRLHRDLSRVAPVYIGGSSSGSATFAEGWESVAGLQNVVQCMKEVVILPLLYPGCFDSLGITPPRGVLLHGYPGTGKTLVVRALVGACARGGKRIAYFSRKGADCLGKYVGDAERQLRLLFQVAEQCQPSIIFFDEIDGLAPKRSRQQDQTHSSVVSTLLALMDGLKPRGSIVVIGATNRPEDLDSALRRPGRFDREIYFPLPSVKDREAILHVHTRKWPKPASQYVLSRVAQQTPGYAGADLQALCTQAAMIALKRQFPLQELLHSTEKKLESNKLPSLPLVTVKESDWAAALVQAPPPCSRRAASMAINDVTALPLQRHMVSALLQPLVELLVSLYRDGCIVLPPVLSEAARLIENIARSNLEEKSPFKLTWWSLLQSISPGSRIAKDIEKCLSSVGLIYDGIDSSNFPFSPGEENARDAKDYGFDSTEGQLKNMEKLKRWGNKGKGVGFRVLITGVPKAGQKYLASCIIHGFEGHVEIRKLNLSTMSQEGHGDIIQGLTHILGIWRNIGPCVIYMPKIEVWALEKVDEISESQGGADQNAVSRTWNMLLQQVDSIPPDVPLVFLATCELPGTALPLQIRNFFMNQDCDVSSLASKKNVPCFSVQLPSTSDCKWLFDQSAKNITKALMRRYIQFIHGLSHGDAISLRKSKTALSLGKLDERAGKNIINCPSKTCIEREDASLDEPKNICSEDDVGGFHKGSQCHSIGAKDYPVLSNIESEHLNLKDRHDWKQQWPSHMLQKPSHRGSGKGRTAMQLAIAACGYQLLHYPQFAELCWVTSKLNEGPCATTDGPWKRWPFNSCILDTNSSTQVASEDSSAEHKGVSASSVVRGLVAVGLLAFKGLYSTGKEVSRDIRKVLELLVKKIKTKIQNGKDKYQFFPLLAQAASLEDMINSWAYATQSLETNSCIPVVDPSPCAEERSELSSQALTDINMVGHGDVNVQATSDAFPVSNLNNKKVISGNTLSPNVFKPGIYGPATCIIGREISSPRSLLANNAVLQGGCQPISPPVCDPNKFLLRGASVAQNNVDSGDAIEKSAQEATAARPTSFCRMINGTLSKADPSDGYEVQSGIKRSETLSTDHHFHDSETGILQSHGASADKNGGNVDATNKIEDSNLLSSQVQCVYRCCSECIHRLHLLVKQFVMNCWKADGCCDRFESVHDLVASCTARLLAVVAQFGVSKSTNESGSMKGSVLLGQSSCSCEDTCDFHSVQTSSRGDANIKNEEITIRGCKCHASPRKRNARWRHGQDTSWLEANLEFVIFDHVCNSNMKSLDRTEDLHIHCQTEHVCFCSLIQKLSAIKQPRW